MKSTKSFLMSQKVLQLTLGVFVLANTYRLVKTINESLFAPVANYFSRQLTEKINVGTIGLGVGADVEAVVDGCLVFAVAMVFVHIIMKVAKVNLTKIPLMAGVDIN